MALADDRLPKSKELPTAEPAEVGMSAEKLSRVVPFLEKFVEHEKSPGAIVMVARRGKVVLFESVGWRDIDAQRVMEKDSILRFYSMTKPLTSAALMMMVEEGKVRLDDPVLKHLPEFEQQVFVEETDDGRKLVAPKRPMTVRDLLRHTSGLTYGFYGNTPIDKEYRAAKLLARDKTLKESIEQLAGLPLLHQPGVKWNYSISTDVVGRLVERLSDTPLDEFFRRRILEPLDMRDTAFFVPESKADRFANNYGPTIRGGLRVIDRASESRYLRPPKMFSGGGGLVSTARDYMRFCQMLLNKGELQGRRLLKTETVEKMTRNQLDPQLLPIALSGGPLPGVGFGLGFSVVVERIKAAPLVPIGEYGWGGAASTHFWISPKHGLAVIVLTQFMPFSFQLEGAVKPLVYRAIEDH